MYFNLVNTSKNVRALRRDLESITGLLVARKSIDTLDTRWFGINYYVISQLILRFYFSHPTWTRTGLEKMIIEMIHTWIL
jgi:hypothetical protein